MSNPKPPGFHRTCLDHQGVRWFRQGNEIGFINPGNLFVPVVGSSGSFSRMADATGGNFFYVDIITGDVSRLDRPMRIDALTVSTAAGGFIPIELNAPAPRGNEAYLVVCGVSGASPGTPWGSTICPINADVITQVALWLAVNNNPATTNWSGFLDANGHATGEMRFYPGTIPSGVTFNLAFIAGNPEYTSNTVSIHVLP